MQRTFVAGSEQSLATVLIDLGQWFGERYGIAAEEEPLSEELKLQQPPSRPQ